MHSEAELISRSPPQKLVPHATNTYRNIIDAKVQLLVHLQAAANLDCIAAPPFMTTKKQSRVLLRDAGEGNSEGVCYWSIYVVRLSCHLGQPASQLCTMQFVDAHKVLAGLQELTLKY